MQYIKFEYYNSKYSKRIGWFIQFLFSISLDGRYVLNATAK